MPTSLDAVGPSPRLKVNYSKRPSAEWGIRSHGAATHADGSYAGYRPFFPRIFVEQGLTYTRSYEVFNTHYLQVGLYGKNAKHRPTALMGLEHYGLYQHLLFLAKRGEKFYQADLAANLIPHEVTIQAMLDRLENLRLIVRVRNSNSRDRWISLVMMTPLHPDKMFDAGKELMTRVNTGFVEGERKRVGPGNWPLLTWDATMAARVMNPKMTGHAGASKKLTDMREAISIVIRDISQPGAREYSDDEVRDMVRDLCHRWARPWNEKTFQTGMTWMRLKSGGV